MCALTTVLINSWFSEKIFSDEKKNVRKCLDTGWLSSEGLYVKKFEESFSKYNNRTYGVAVSSGTAALEIGMKSLNLKKGDEVIVPAHTYCATVLPFCRYGARIRWADINLDTMTIDINHVKRLINYKTKIIIGLIKIANSSIETVDEIDNRIKA